MISMNEDENEPYICFNCDAEFIIHTPYDTEDEVSFCPYCGSEIEHEEPDSDEDDEDDF